MPTYEYECENCKNKFEKFQSIKAEPLTECPSCHGKVRRLISNGGGIIFKGSGFYETDYKRKKESPCPNADKNKPSCKGCNLAKE